ncbi:MAG TPA: hypothetical protein VMZ90_12780 [Vicinamibacterales bacterium]|nr:hypothetical protein [Vicinamibacterales bacterium]
MSANARSYGLPDFKGLLLLYLPVFILLFLVVVGCFTAHVALSSLTRDMAAVAHVHPLVGVVSNVGILLWCATAVICLFSASLLRQLGLLAEARFLMWAGLMTTVLLVDDLFMIHEYIAPVHFHVGEKVVLASYACASGAYLLSHRRLILAANYQLLAAAMVLFTASMAVDFSDVGGWWRLSEDGFKILGIVSWLGYHAGRARHWLVHAPVQNRTIATTPAAEILKRKAIEPSARASQAHLRL